MIDDPSAPEIKPAETADWLSIGSPDSQEALERAIANLTRLLGGIADAGTAAELARERRALLRELEELRGKPRR